MIPSSDCPPWPSDRSGPRRKSLWSARQLHHTKGHDPRPPRGSLNGRRDPAVIRGKMNTVGARLDDPQFEVLALEGGYRGEGAGARGNEACPLFALAP